MITLIHLLQHLGLPSGVAIAVVIAARKLVKGGLARAIGHRATGHRAIGHRDQDRRSARRYR